MIVRLALGLLSTWLREAMALLYHQSSLLAKSYGPKLERFIHDGGKRVTKECRSSTSSHLRYSIVIVSSTMALSPLVSFTTGRRSRVDTRYMPNFNLYSPVGSSEGMASWVR